MEVHSHTHTARKKWTHYFWEFFMLFLAVTAGFLVENLREHNIEHRREKQYMYSMVQDLRSDTLHLNTAIRQMEYKENIIDTLVELLTSPDYKEHGKQIYIYARRIPFPAYFFPNDRTILQLKSSGSLRLIRNMGISDSIMLYDQDMRALLFQFSDEATIRGEYRLLAGDVFSGQVFYTMLDKNNPFNVKVPTGNPQLIQQNAITLNRLITQLVYLRNVSRNQRGREQELREKAIRLILLLQKEYHLE